MKDLNDNQTRLDIIYTQIMNHQKAIDERNALLDKDNLRLKEIEIKYEKIRQSCKSVRNLK